MATKNSITQRAALTTILDSTIGSYSVVFFSQDKFFGFLLLLATFVEPLKGAYGLIALLLSNAFATVLGFDRQAIRKGYFGFNALLVGLALSYFYAPSTNLFLLTLLASLLTTLVTSVLLNVLWYYFRLPTLSVPFVLIFSIAISASLGFGTLEVASASRMASLHMMGGPAIELFAKSLGSVFFQVNILSGLIILLGLLITSRLALVLGAVGLAAGYFTHTLLGADPLVLTEQYLGFNYILTGIAIGGIFLLPSGGSLLMAAGSAAASALIMLSARSLLPSYLPLTAIPFNGITLLVLYALKTRAFPSEHLQLALTEVSTPEENLSARRMNLKTFRRYGVELSLPFHGKWFVSQGFNGNTTHREEWRHAVDFMVRDGQGKVHKAAGEKPEEYYCFGLPLLAPADGNVVFVQNNVPENPIGKVNERENWGNAVIIEHAFQYFSCLAHLKKGSVLASVGDLIKRGQVIGRCGNSGRSPFPHLHFQMQALPQLGAATLDFQFSHFLVEQERERNFILRGIPHEQDVVTNFAGHPEFHEFFPYSFTHDFVYDVRGARSGEERWSTEIDFYGNLILKSYPVETRMYFTMADGVLSIKKLEGARTTGLYQFGQLLTDVPIIKGERLHWPSSEESDYPLPPGLTALYDLLALLGFRFRFVLDNALEASHSSLKLTSDVRFTLRTPLGSITLPNRVNKLQFTFARKMGLTHFSDGRIELQLKETVPHEDGSKKT